MAPTAPGGGGAARIIGASSLGTLFEWYDFYLYGALAGSFAAHFFSGVNETTSFLLALATFAVGFVVRPLGAILFGRLGDLVGRKFTFLATLVLMGVSTFLVGLLPGAAAIGVAAPLLLVALRILQGLAIGGEFGGAIVYVAEHAPEARRALHASFIPATALAGLLLSLAVIAATRAAMPAESFAAWGWRLPFLLSAVLLAVSLWIRLRLQESPVFRRMQEESVEHGPTGTESAPAIVRVGDGAAKGERADIERHVPADRRCARRRQRGEETPPRQDLGAVGPHYVSRDGIARKRGSVYEQHLESLSRQEHGGRRARTSCADDNGVVHRTSLSN